jgi:predicted homoserine dehydrogenase-like protein
VILVDRALEEREARHDPIRVGMVGAGFMGKGIALQLTAAVSGMKLVGIANRTVDKAVEAFREAGVADSRVVSTGAALDRSVQLGMRGVTEDPSVLYESEAVDVVLEVTGAVEFGAGVVLNAIRHGKHVVTMSAELDATVGAVLHQRAVSAGVVYSGADGDQPGVTMNLYRFVNGIGVRPVLCGNIKGLHDPYRNPTTQRAFAEKWGQTPHMVTSFADGTKISFEQAAVANATGMKVGRRGMYGPTVPPGTPITESTDWYPLQDLTNGPGIVDYVVGASPAPGVFVLGMHDHPTQRNYLKLYKLGDGPLYCFHTPYHLCHFEVHNAIARAALFGDATIAPWRGPCVDVVATAKTDLPEGHVLDGIGGYDTYGLAENSWQVEKDGILPMGLAEGGRLRRSVARDTVLTYDDVILPEGRLTDELRKEQSTRFQHPTRDDGDRT